MQPRPNNDLRSVPSEKAKGIAGTAIIHIVVLAILVLFSFTVPPPPEFEEGIMVNFGTTETGFGEVEPSEAAVQQQAAPPPAARPRVQAEEEALATQDFEEAPEVKKVDPEAEKKRLEKIEADRKMKARLEEERKLKEEAERERQRVEAEQKRQAEIMNRTRNALANSKNAGTTSGSEGIAGGTGNQGDPRGSVDSKIRGEGSGTGNKGVSYSLEGRGFQSLPAPKYDIQSEGRVIVEIYVDRSGKVTQAIPGVKGSTTLDENLLRVAKEAAMLARFDSKPDAPVTQKGTITYNFILK